MTCEHCGAPLPPDAKTCPACGHPLAPVSPEVEQEIAMAMAEAQTILDRQKESPKENPSAGAGDKEKEKTPEAPFPENTDREEPSLPRQVEPPLAGPAPAAPLPPEPRTAPEGNQGESAPDPEGPAPEESGPQPEDPGQQGPVYARKNPRRGTARQRTVPEGDPTVPSTWHYFLMQLVLGLPIIGFILSIIWGLEEGGPLHRKNFARANILYSLLKLLFKLVILGVVISLLSTIMGLLMSYGYYYDPYYGYDPYYDDFFGWYDDYGSYGEPPYYYNSADNSSYWQGETALTGEGTESV